MKRLSGVAVFAVVAALAVPSLLQAQNNPKGIQGLYPDSLIEVAPQNTQSGLFSEDDCRYATGSETTKHGNTTSFAEEVCVKRNGGETLKRGRVFVGTETASHSFGTTTTRQRGGRLVECQLSFPSSLPSTQSEAADLRQKLKGSSNPTQTLLDTINSYDSLTGNDTDSCRKAVQKLKRRVALLGSAMRAP